MSFAQYLLRILAAASVILLLTAGTVVTFNHVVFSNRDELDGMYDVYRYFAPITFLVDHCIHTGEFPLWNPLTYCGMPVTGNPQSFLFYIPHLIRSLLTFNPTPERSNITLAIMWGLHLIFMGFCTYLLGRSHKLTFSGSLTAAAAFVFSALMVRRMGEYHFITSLAWMPLLLLLIKKAIDTEDFFAKTGLAICAGLTLESVLQAATCKQPTCWVLFPPCTGSFISCLTPIGAIVKVPSTTGCAPGFITVPPWRSFLLSVRVWPRSHCCPPGNWFFQLALHSCSARKIFRSVEMDPAGVLPETGVVLRYQVRSGNHS